MSKIKDFTDLILNKKTFQFSTLDTPNIKEYPVKLSYSQGEIEHFMVDFEKYLPQELVEALNQKLNIPTIITWEQAFQYLGEIVSFFTANCHLDHHVNKFIYDHYCPYLLKSTTNDNTNFLENYLSKEIEKIEPNGLFLKGLIPIAFEANFSIVLSATILKKVFDSRIDYHSDVFRLAGENIDLSKELIVYLDSDLTPKYDELVGQLIGGICSTSFVKEVDFMKKLFEFDKYQPTILWGLIRISHDLTNDFDQIIHFAESNNGEDTVLYNLMRLYVIIWHNYLTNDNISSHCINGIEKLLLTDKEGVHHAFFNTLRAYSKDAEKGITKLVKVFLKNPNHAVSVLSPNRSNIGTFDWCMYNNIQSPQYFFEILRSYINDTSHLFEIGVLHQSMPQMLTKHPKESMKFILECLVDKRGKMRHLGHTLLEFNLKHHPESRFGHELKELAIEQQMILLLSISIPQTISFSSLFRQVVPLLELNEESVSQLVIKILFQKSMRESGLGEVIKEELKDGEIKDVILPVIEQMDKRFREIDEKKSELKEFDPKYSQRQILEKYNKYFQESFSKMFQKSWQEDSLFQIFGKSIVLLKGGGFRSEHDDTFSPLGHFQSSLTMPTSLFLDYDKQMVETNVYFNQNWENSNDWEEWLRKF